MPRASSRTCSAALLVGCLALGHGHGYMTWPPSRQLHGRSGMAMGGDCVDTITCSWFSQPAYIPGEPTLNAAPLRTMNVDVAGGDSDWSRQHPWRSPGAAPVVGSGCGSAGGGPVPYRNHGMAPRNGPPQGTDGITLPVGAEVTTWRRGSEEEVAWAISANHGGGYSWRLCPADGNISESCFKTNALRFAPTANRSWIQWGEDKVSRSEVARVTVLDETWARSPIPACLICNPLWACGPFVDMVPYNHSPGAANNCSEWAQHVICATACEGSITGSCPDGDNQAQFPPPLPGLRGFGSGASGLGRIAGLPAFSVVDKVVVPPTLKPGKYLLSWRWDCEQSPQVWQNCADIRVV